MAQKPDYTFTYPKIKDGIQGMLGRLHGDILVNQKTALDGAYRSGYLTGKNGIDLKAGLNKANKAIEAVRKQAMKYANGLDVLENTIKGRFLGLNRTKFKSSGGSSSGLKGGADFSIRNPSIPRIKRD